MIWKKALKAYHWLKYETTKDKNDDRRTNPSCKQYVKPIYDLSGCKGHGWAYLRAYTNARESHKQKVFSWSEIVGLPPFHDVDDEMKLRIINARMSRRESVFANRPDLSVINAVSFHKIAVNIQVRARLSTGCDFVRNCTLPMVAQRDPSLIPTNISLKDEMEIGFKQMAESRHQFTTFLNELEKAISNKECGTEIGKSLELIVPPAQLSRARKPMKSALEPTNHLRSYSRQLGTLRG